MKIGGKMTPLKFIQATADFGEPENTPLARFCQRSGHAKDKRVTGPITYAIDGKADTAWGIDAGPGRRNVPRNAVFVLEKPDRGEARLRTHHRPQHETWRLEQR
jgi:hypothetical protein